MSEGANALEPYYEQKPLHFYCTCCGRCCVGGNEYYVFLSENESDRIRRFLGLSYGWFRRRYLRRLEAGELVAALEDNGSCVFLDRKGRCRVYPVRPVQCTTYPFWPEVAGSRTAWQRESRRCEGINRGGVIPVEVIRQKVKCMD